MNIDPGLVVVIAAVMIFYLRLIIIQRQRVKRLAQQPHGASKYKQSQKNAPLTRYSILSPSWQDRTIAGVGALAILSGVILNANLLPFPALQPYWWIPTALGIIAFSWGFKL